MKWFGTFLGNVYRKSDNFKFQKPTIQRKIRKFQDENQFLKFGGRGCLVYLQFSIQLGMMWSICSVGYFTQRWRRREIILEQELIFYFAALTLACRYILATDKYVKKGFNSNKKKIVLVVHFLFFVLPCNCKGWVRNVWTLTGKIHGEYIPI